MSKKTKEENKEYEHAKVVFQIIAMSIIMLVVAFIGIYYGCGIFEKMPR